MPFRRLSACSRWYIRPSRRAMYCSCCGVGFSGMMMPPPGRMPSTFARSRPAFSSSTQSCSCICLAIASALVVQVTKAVGRRGGSGTGVSSRKPYALCEPVQRCRRLVSGPYARCRAPDRYGKRLSLPALYGAQQGVKSTGGGSGGAEMARAVAARMAKVHPDPPAGTGGLVGGEGLHRQQHLDRIAGVGRRHRGQRCVHMPPLRCLGFLRVERMCPHQGLHGVRHEHRIERTIFMENGLRIVERVDLAFEFADRAREICS